MESKVIEIVQNSSVRSRSVGFPLLLIQVVCSYSEIYQYYRTTVVVNEYQFHIFYYNLNESYRHPCNWTFINNSRQVLIVRFRINFK